MSAAGLFRFPPSPGHMGSPGATNGDRIARIEAHPLDVPMREPFEIAGGAQTEVRNVLIQAVLEDGTRGFGECAPMPAFNGETQAATLAAARGASARLEGVSVGRRAVWSGRLRRCLRRRSAARAGMEMALLDAWGRRERFPLRLFFGGAGCRVKTDITIPIVPPEAAAREARRIVRRGVRTIKIKVGRDPAEDADRVEAAMAAAGRPAPRLLLDANAGYDAAAALRLLSRLSRRRIRPALFEQPVPERDWAGLRSVARLGRVPVAADESASSSSDVVGLARTGSAQVINVKLMKFGVIESLAVARTARAAGLGLMIGGLVESRLAMTCAAHLAAGFGGFSFVDLDTPLFFAEDPMTGPRMGRGGVYDLSRVRAGIGVAPKPARRIF